MSETTTDSTTDADSDDAETDSESEAAETDAGSDDAETDAGSDDAETEAHSDAGSDAAIEADATTDAEKAGESPADSALRRNLYRAGLGLFGLLAVVAVLQLYASVNATINTFVAREYRSLFRAAFNLAVLLASGAGISWCVHELGGE